MPGLDRKGPFGEGPMTGGKMGRCNPENKGKTEQEILQSRYAAAAETGNLSGRGSGRGRGPGKGSSRGRGMRFRNNG